MTEPNTSAPPAAAPDRRLLMTVTWLWVGLPFCYGVYELILKLKLMFTG
ncbi:MFS transporter small subunit [Streptomyces sp. TP-A0874]|nr:hypothetical protein [Streptomyces sp. TP-A0874]